MNICCTHCIFFENMFFFFPLIYFSQFLSYVIVVNKRYILHYFSALIYVRIVYSWETNPRTRRIFLSHSCNFFHRQKVYVALERSIRNVNVRFRSVFFLVCFFFANQATVEFHGWWMLHYTSFRYDRVIVMRN